MRAPEWVLQVQGRVRPRPEGSENPNLPTGAVEVEAQSVKVLNPAKTPPFLINKDEEVDENTRLRYRYLDLRRERMQHNLELRHRVVKFIRDYLDERASSKSRRRSCSKPRRKARAITWCPRVSPGRVLSLCRSRPSSSSSC